MANTDPVIDQLLQALELAFPTAKVAYLEPDATSMEVRLYFQEHHLGMAYKLSFADRYFLQHNSGQHTAQIAAEIQKGLDEWVNSLEKTPKLNYN